MNVITTVAGTDFLFDGDGRPAVGAPLANFLQGVKVSPRGEPHFADTFNGMIMKVRGDGILEVVAGNGAGFIAGIGGQRRWTTRGGA